MNSGLPTEHEALAQCQLLCDFVNRWALAPCLNSLAKSLETQPKASDKGLKCVPLGARRATPQEIG